MVDNIIGGLKRLAQEYLQNEIFDMLLGAVGFKDFKRPTGSTAPFQFTPVPVLGGVTNPFHGSHADGLHSIPFLGCRAELHVGN